MTKNEEKEIHYWFEEARNSEMGQELSTLEELYGPYKTMLDISIEFLNNTKPKVTFSTSSTTSAP